MPPAEIYRYSAGGCSFAESSEVMSAAAGTQILKGTDDFLDLLKAFAIRWCVIRCLPIIPWGGLTTVNRMM